MCKLQNVPLFIEVPNQIDKGIRGCGECCFYFDCFNFSCRVKPYHHWEVNPKCKEIVSLETK